MNVAGRTPFRAAAPTIPTHACEMKTLKNDPTVPAKLPVQAKPEFCRQPDREGSATQVKTSGNKPSEQDVWLTSGLRLTLLTKTVTPALTEIVRDHLS